MPQHSSPLRRSSAAHRFIGCQTGVVRDRMKGDQVASRVKALPLDQPGFRFCGQERRKRLLTLESSLNRCRVGKGRPAGSIELRVSPSPSKIPYGGFSPVRLQMDRQWRPSTTSQGLSAVHIRPMTPSYTPPQFLLPGVRDPRRDFPVLEPFGSMWHDSQQRQHVHPEALGSPSGYVVPAGHRLLRPHPPL